MQNKNKIWYIFGVIGFMVLVLTLIKSHGESLQGYLNLRDRTSSVNSQQKSVGTEKSTDKKAGLNLDFTDNKPPEVKIISPTNEQTINTPIFVVIATAKDNIGIKKIEFYSGFTKIGTQTSPDENGYYKYLIDVSGKPINTTIWLSAWAYDLVGNISKETISYVIDNKGPDLTLTPKAGDKFYDLPDDGKVMLNAKAVVEDPSGVSKVMFYFDGKLVSTITKAPYTHSWQTTKRVCIGEYCSIESVISPGLYKLYVEAYDNNGNLTEEEIDVRIYQYLGAGSIGEVPFIAIE